MNAMNYIAPLDREWLALQGQLKHYESARVAAPLPVHYPCTRTSALAFRRHCATAAAMSGRWVITVTPG